MGVSETFSLDSSTSTSSYHLVAKKVRTGDPVESVVRALVPNITVTVDGGSTSVVSYIVGSSKKIPWQLTLRMTMTMTIPLYPPLGSTLLETSRNKIMYSFFFMTTCFNGFNLVCTALIALTALHSVAKHHNNIFVQLSKNK